jgi:uncharacterized membrane protein YphA (DoxX/SURF4 family)
MKAKANFDFRGHSLIVNLLLVLTNLSGFTFVVLGFHDNFEDQFVLFNVIGFTLLAFSIAGIMIFKGKLMMASVSRALVGGLFIVSGLVKANDPVGFSYKLEEYFEDGALAYRIKEWFGAPGFSLEVFIQYALFLSVLICVVEIVLGILIIIGGKIKLVSYLTILMMLFFTFLTWHTANCDATKKFVDRDTYPANSSLAKIKLEESKTNKLIKIVSKSATEIVVDEKKQPQCVDDCGCFGDAMKGSIGRSLTPKESLWKDIIVLYLSIWIFLAQWRIQPNTGKQNLYYSLSSLGLIAFFSWVFSWYFPIIFAVVSILGALWVLKAGGKTLGNYLGSTLVVTLICCLFVGYVLRYEPMKDYRPYAEGAHLKWKMTDGVAGVYENAFVLKNLKSGKEETYSEAVYMKDENLWDAKKFKFIKNIQKVIIPSRIPSITEQFNPFLPLTDLTEKDKKNYFIKTLFEGKNVEGVIVKDLAYNSTMNVPMTEFSLTDYPVEQYTVLDTALIPDPSFTEIALRDFIVNAPLVYMLNSKNVSDEKANWKQINRYKAINAYCVKHKIPFFMITSSAKDEINAFRKKYNLTIPIFYNDETELKAISRSNPALLVIQNGIVKGKFPHRSTPTVEWLMKNIPKK